MMWSGLPTRTLDRDCEIKFGRHDCQRSRCHRVWESQAHQFLRPPIPSPWNVESDEDIPATKSGPCVVLLDHSGVFRSFRRELGFGRKSHHRANRSPRTGEKSIEYWITQLGSDHYLRRESASKNLVAAGPEAVEALAKAIRSGDLEVVERAAAALVEIAIVRPPEQDGGVYDQLSTLADQTVGRASSVALGATREIRSQRHAQARDALAKAGIEVKVTEFVINATPNTRTVVDIDQNWNGDVASLQWLAWLEGVDTARVRDQAVTPEVLRFVAQIPELRSLAIVDGTVDDDTLKPLTRINGLESLDFRYAILSDRQIDLLAAIRIRDSLNLMGTGISAAKAEELQQRIPGRQITHRKGGFLGVTCHDLPDRCEIHTIVPNGAAEAAGLLENDVVVQIGDAEIHRFRDLQLAINELNQGDEVEVHYRRGGGEEIHRVTVRLKRFEEK